MLYVHQDRERRLTLRRLRRDEDGVLRGADYSPDGWPARPLADLGDLGRGDPRPRPWYQAARAARAQVWTESYLFLGADGRPGAPGITCATPLLAPDGRLLGVLSVDFELASLWALVRRIRVLDRGQLFIIERPAGAPPRILAHPDPAAVRATYPGAAGGAPADDHGYRAFLDDVLAALAASDEETIGGWVPFRVVAHGVAQVAAARPFRRRGAPPWLIAVALPDDELNAALYETVRNTLAAGVLATALAILLVVLLARQIAHPLTTLQSEAERIGHFDLAPRPLPGGRIHEIASLVETIDAMKAGLRSFSKYVPAELVRMLVDSGEDAMLGGARRRLTVFFSDIEGFTSIAEATPPELLLELLAEYFEVVGAAMERHRATVDKFIGDAVMAFWGAPRPDPLHATHACRAALEVADQLDALNRRRAAAGRPAFPTRIGIATGDLIVGNVGFASRLSYTVIGDTVNLASRIEGLNKAYGTRLLVHEATAREVAAAFVLRPVDRVAVKGREEGVVLFEVVASRRGAGAAAPARPAPAPGTPAPAAAAGPDAPAPASPPPPDAEPAWVATACRAFDLYQAREFLAAASLYDAVVAARAGGDRAAELLAARCRAFAVVPPPADWDGSYHATEK